MVRSWLKTFLMLAISCFISGTAAAQRPGHDSGEFVILSAQYGTERHHVDVTQRLKEEARRDMKFRTSNRTFGVDPDPGVVKTLRIYARGLNGREQMFEFVEGSVVDGAMFRGWGRGDWGTERWSGRWNADEGEYLILSARYGTEHHSVDVTDRLKDLARADRTFRLANRVFGVDPDYGKVKTMRIYARGPNGRVRMFEYVEGSLVDGSQFRGWGRGDWGHAKERWTGHWNGEER
jgi:hypothetical protein